MDGALKTNKLSAAIYRFDTLAQSPPNSTGGTDQTANNDIYKNARVTTERCKNLTFEIFQTSNNAHSS